MSQKIIRHILFSLVVIAFLYYGFRYIEASSYTIDGTKYYILFDDAMISMRYAYNLAHGFGPVWNPGERVEGFTNPLWVGYMALFHLLPIPLSKTSLAIQGSGLIFLTANLFFVRKIVEHFTEDLGTMLAAVIFTAFYQPLISWGLLGMEVSVLTLLLSAVTWLVLRNGSANFSAGIYVLLAVSTLFRFDMAVPFVIILAALLIVQPQFRRQHLWWGLGLLAISLGGQTIARYLYYGQLLPNTYYLKVEGWPFVLRILRGLYALTWFAYYSNWVIFLLPFSILIFRRDWKTIFLFAIFSGQVAYSVYVGGDAWEHHGGANRYISIAMPLFFILLTWAIDLLRNRILTLLNNSRMAAVGLRTIWLIVMVFSIINLNLLIGDWKSIERWTLERKPDFVAGNEHYLTIAYNLKKFVKPQATVAVTAAGSTAYFLPAQYMIDVLGKADSVVAHGPIRSPMSIIDVPLMQPGHMKWNYAYTIGELGPDVIVDLRDGTDSEAAQYLLPYVRATAGDRIFFYLKKDSPNILWDKVIIKD